MVVGEKSHHKLSDRKIRKVLDKNDPFDQLIIELAEKGVLDVCAVDIDSEQTKHPEHVYSRRPTPPKGKHTS